MNSPIRLGNIILGWLIDFLAVAAALAFAIDLTLENWMRNTNSPAAYIIPCYAIPALNIIWLQIRVGSRMPALAIRPRREEIALTYLPAKKYLVPYFKWPIIRSLMPTCLAWPLLTISIFNQGNGEGIAELLVLMSLCSIISGLAIAIAGIFDLLIRQCSVKSTGGISCWLIPAAWCISGITAMISPFLLLMAFYEKGELALALLAIAIALLCVINAAYIFSFGNLKVIQLFKSKTIIANDVLIFAIWSLFTIAFPFGILLYIGILPRASLDQYFRDNEALTILASAVISLPLAALALINVSKRWQQTVIAYYHFK